MKNEVVKERNSNFELMRIVSMLLIVLWHCLYHSGLWVNTKGVLNNVVIILCCMTMVHVNSFVLLSGYFQSKGHLKMSKLIKLNNSIWFYSAILTFIFFVFGINHDGITKVTLLHNLLPIDYNTYWYTTCYLVLYIISPILNMVINSCDQNKLKKIILMLFITLSILPALTNNGFLFNTGFTLSNFIMLYFIGAYIRMYPIDKNYFMKVLSKTSQKFILIFIFCFCFITNFLITFYGNSLLNSNSGIIQDIGHVLSDNRFYYSNPLIILQSVCYIGFFSLLNIKSKFINKIASYTLGVYLISDNSYVRGWLYKFVGFKDKIYSPSILIKVIGLVFAIFTICIFIEAIRQFIFKKIYNTKLANKNRIWYRNFIDSFGLKINW